MIGALLIVTGVLVLLLIESKKARAEVAATLGSSVVRQNALSQELRAEIEEINKQNLLEMAAVSKDHHYEMENLRCAFHAIRPPSPPTSGHLFHAHPAGQSERSDAGLHC